MNSSLDQLRENIARVYLGSPRAIEYLLVGLLARGHVLIEDRPGVGKTVLAKSLARSIDCRFSRIQLTPDLLPGDVLGVSIFNSSRNEFEFKQGPIFANIVLADEINRTTPRTQSALLEAMSEEQVSVDNTTHQLARPFMVLATQNPFGFEGTYPLPENQLDRFLIRVTLGYPSRAGEQRILTTRPGRVALDQLQPVLHAEDIVRMQDQIPEIRLDPAVVEYILDLVEATRQHEQLELGVSPRGALALTSVVQAAAFVRGRDYVLPDDVKELFLPCCAHRVVGKSYLQNGTGSERVLREILDTVPAPR